MITARNAGLVIAALIVLRAVMAGLLPLSADEAYYWLWSRHLAAGYYDHPPAIAFVIRFGTFLFGDNEFGVRFGGVMLSLLLARRGVPVTLLEAHHDFDRDFRGDTVHPSTLEILDHLGLAERLLQLPHGKPRTLQMVTRAGTFTWRRAAEQTLDVLEAVAREPR